MEELITDKRKKIVAMIINKLSQEDPNLYYIDSSAIANLVVSKIKKEQGLLSKSELELVKDLNHRDIVILMSYNSNCC